MIFCQAFEPQWQAFQIGTGGPALWIGIETWTTEAEAA